MLEEARSRTISLQDRMQQRNIGTVIFTDESSIAYLAGFWGYLGIDFGRSIGIAYLEAPELKAGDKTVLQAGMTFAVDGGISIDGDTSGSHWRLHCCN